MLLPLLAAGLVYGALALPAVEIQTTHTPPGMVDVPYALTFVAMWGMPPYVWDADFADLPFGLDMDDETGTLGGIPEDAGTSTFWVTVTDANGTSASNEYTLIIVPASTGLFFQTADLLYAVHGQPYSESILVIGGLPPYTWQIISGSPPLGISMSTNSGLLAGSPVSALRATFAVRASDKAGASIEREFTVHVILDTLPMIMPGELADATLSNLVSVQLSAQGVLPPVWWSVEFPEELPPGIEIDLNEGRLFGAPLETGLFSFTVLAESALSGEVSRAYNWRVTPPVSGPVLPAIMPPNGTPGAAYMFQTDATGGTPPYDYTLVEGHLPSGFVFYAATAGLAGNTLETGQFWYVVEVSDLNKKTDVRGYAFQVRYSDVLHIDTTYLPDGWVSRNYELELQAGGGTPPYAWDIAAGSLPSGIELATNSMGDSVGILRGTPVTGGTFWCTLLVTDDEGQVAQRVFALTVNPAPEALAFETTALSDAIYGEKYDSRILVRGGIPPYTWSISPITGTPPPGIVLIPETGMIGGYPTDTGTFAFVCEVTDQEATLIQRLFAITVWPQDGHLQFITTVLRTGSTHADYFDRIYVGGGTPPYLWHLASGSLPTGITLATNTGILIGAPVTTCTNTLLIQVTDGGGESIARFFTLMIDALPRMLSIDDTAVDSGYVGEPYEFAFSASGGRLPYTWSKPSGTLPPGLILRTDGRLDGTPLTYGAWAFSVRVRDALGTNVLQSYVMKVFNDSEPVITTEALPYGKVGTYYTATLDVMGGTPPYVWSVNAADLPPGLSFNTNSGVISGTIANVPMDDTFLIDVDVADAQGESDYTTVEFNLDTLNILAIPSASFKLNWNYDLWDRDMFSIKFTAQLPPGFTRFYPEGTELFVEFGDYSIWSGNEVVKINKTGTTYSSKEGNAKRDPFFGGRMDVPVILVKMKADVVKRILTGTVKVKYDDGTGGDFYLNNDIYFYQGVYPVTVELTVNTNTFRFIGHEKVTMDYKGNPVAQKGSGKKVKP